MLQDKDTNKISELKSGFTHRWLETDFILGSLTCFKLSNVSKCFTGIKQNGYCLSSLFGILLSLPYLGQHTVHGLLNSYVEKPERIHFTGSKIKVQLIGAIYCGFLYSGL